MKSLCLLMLLSPCVLLAEEGPTRARTYTNEDLDRVSARREETGVSSAPAETRPAPAEAPGARGRDAGEAHWRREADRLRRRLYPLQERAGELQERIESRRRQPGVRPYSDEQVRALEARLAALRQRIAEEESRLLEGARRAGALPEWLR